MRSFFAVWLAVTTPVALVACGNGCPEITAWRGATTTSDGALVCARIYGDTSCSGFPLQLAINASDTDLNGDLASLQAGQSLLTALIRPGCRLHLWNESDFGGEERSSSSYQWEFDASGVLSARCDCESDNVELLRCEPLVEMIKIQECDYQNSLVGGICPYSVHLQPFRSDNGSIHELPSLTGDPITEDEVSAIKSMFPLHAGGRLDSPTDGVMEKLVRYVAPRHKLVVKQKVLGCGAFAIPTSEVSENVEEGRWLSYRSSNKQILISTYTASRTKAAADCSERGFALASLYQKADAVFAARIIASLHTMGWSSSFAYWTAAGQQYRRYGYDPKCRLIWPNTTIKEDISFRCNELQASVLGRPAPNGTWSYEAAHDHESNHFICEMTL